MLYHVTGFSYALKLPDNVHMHRPSLEPDRLLMMPAPCTDTYLDNLHDLVHRCWTAWTRRWPWSAKPAMAWLHAIAKRQAGWEKPALSLPYIYIPARLQHVYPQLPTVCLHSLQMQERNNCGDKSALSSQIMSQCIPSNDCTRSVRDRTTIYSMWRVSD